jgi:hypothetical protein
MGANFQTMTLPGTTSRDEVTKTFSKVQDRDRSQNDSQYAGGFGMCSGLILTDYNFHIRRTAEAYLVGRSQKWDHALAVKDQHGNHGIAAAGVRQQRALRPSCVDGHIMAGLQEVRRHAGAHVSQSDESYLHGNTFFLCG